MPTVRVDPLAIAHRPRATVKGTVVSGRIEMNLWATAYTHLYLRAATSYAGSVSNCCITKVK